MSPLSDFINISLTGLPLKNILSLPSYMQKENVSQKGKRRTKNSCVLKIPVNIDKRLMMMMSIDNFFSQTVVFTIRF